MVTGVLDPRINVVDIVVALAGDYADEIVASLPEDDPTVLRDGLVGALVSFFADAVLATSE